MWLSMMCRQIAHSAFSLAEHATAVLGVRHSHPSTRPHVHQHQHWGLRHSSPPKAHMLLCLFGSHDNDVPYSMQFCVICTEFKAVLCCVMLSNMIAMYTAHTACHLSSHAMAVLGVRHCHPITSTSFAELLAACPGALYNQP